MPGMSITVFLAIHHRTLWFAITAHPSRISIIIKLRLALALLFRGKLKRKIHPKSFAIPAVIAY